MKDTPSMKLMILWHGAVVPSYRYFFQALAKSVDLVVVSPKAWKHGSKVYRLKTDASGSEPDASATGYRLLGMRCWFSGTSRYILPAWPLVLNRHRPTHVYIMDEVDRLATFWHVFLARAMLPDCKVATYSLQNLEHPEYYKWRHSFFLKRNFARVHGIIAATREARKVLESHGNQEFHGNKRSFLFCGPVPLGVSREFFQPGDKKSLRRKRNLPPEKPLILFAGSLHPSKGVDMLLKAAKKLPNLQFVFVGEGPLFTPLQTILMKHIRVIHAVPGEALREYYQMSDYVILPSRTTSRWKEQVGRFLLEGVLCGAVALGSDSGNIPDITRMKEAVFSEGNQRELFSLLKSLPLKNHAAVHRRQRERVLRHYEWEAVARQTLHCLKRL